MRFSKNQLIVIIVILYIVGVLAFIGVFLIIAIDSNKDIVLSDIILKSFVVAIPPLVYPIYRVIKKK